MLHRGFLYESLFNNDKKVLIALKIAMPLRADIILVNQWNSYIILLPPLSNLLLTYAYKWELVTVLGTYLYKNVTWYFEKTIKLDKFQQK